MKKKAIFGALIILLAYIFGVNLSDLKSFQKTFFPSPTPTLSPTQISTARVLSVIDGDTIIIEPNVKVRYVGIDAPEVDECFAEESLAENKKLVEGKTVKLEKDVSDKDKYGRLLRYIYIDGLFVNEHLIKQGFAKNMGIKPDLRYYQLFKGAQTEAKDFSRGLWQACPPATPKPSR